MVLLFDQFNMPEDIYEIMFATKQQVIVAKLLIQNMKEHDGILTKTAMSMFATHLHDGEVIAEIDDPVFKGKQIKLSYNKRQFYDRILTPMKSMGLIDYDLYKKHYKLSDKFNKAMIKVGILWMQELRRPPQQFALKKEDIMNLKEGSE
ncbi:hypothetical protein HZA99_05585 [Candidatus Woesearchaeota archaeon]|nr:hypothetical protein [Candidatus Woesearchaeota archaeon]